MSDVLATADPDCHQNITRMKLAMMAILDVELIRWRTHDDTRRCYPDASCDAPRGPFDRPMPGPDRGTAGPGSGRRRRGGRGAAPRDSVRRRDRGAFRPLERQVT